MQEEFTQQTVRDRQEKRMSLSVSQKALQGNLRKLHLEASAHRARNELGISWIGSSQARLAFS